MRYNNLVVENPCAGVAQSVVQLIRNQQVVCSSHITSSKKSTLRLTSFAFYETDKKGLLP